MIKTTCTATSKGEIPHLKHNGILLPVRLIRKARGRISSDKKTALPVPETMMGKFVYALPGGGSFVPGE